MVIQPGGAAVGIDLTANTTSASTAIPTLDNGARPKWVYVAFSDTSAGANCTGGIRFGTGTVSAATRLNTTGLSASSPIFVNVSGNAAYTAIADVTSTISVTPLSGINPGG